jgi:hypothetical protein
MPDPYERHGRASGWDVWGPNPSRHQQRAAAAADEAAKRPPAKKDPDLCKAVHWKGPHQPELRIRNFGWRRRMECHWGTTYLDHGDPRWHCVHEEVCAGCGKVLRISIGKFECPYFHEITDEETAAIQADYTRRAELLKNSRRAVRPVINGPQGYRKKKA